MPKVVLDPKISETMSDPEVTEKPLDPLESIWRKIAEERWERIVRLEQKLVDLKAHEQNLKMLVRAHQTIKNLKRDNDDLIYQLKIWGIAFLVMTFYYFRLWYDS